MPKVKPPRKDIRTRWFVKPKRRKPNAYVLP